MKVHWTKWQITRSQRVARLLWMGLLVGLVFEFVTNFDWLFRFPLFFCAWLLTTGVLAAYTEASIDNDQQRRKQSAELLLIAVLCLGAAPAWALSDPTVSTGKDNADRTVTYDPHNRVPLVIQQGGLVVITFDVMESIEQVVKVDTAPFTYACDVAGNDQKQQCEASYSNNLPLVGKTAGSGDLVVLTRGAPPNNDKERAYLFAVRVVAGDDPQITKHLTFLYSGSYQTPAPMPATTLAAASAGSLGDPPSDPPRRFTWKEKKAQHDAEIIRARLHADATFGPQNTQYIAQGVAHNIAPVAAFDNGTLTAFRYPGNMSQPAVFKVIDNREGKPAVCTPGGAAVKADLEAPEQAVNTRVVDDLLTVDDTAPHWRLRQGEAVVDIWNCGYDPIGHPTGTGTDSPAVIRRIIQP